MDTHRMPAPAADTPMTLDARLPDSIAMAAEELGVRKAHYDTPTLLALAVLAGAFIALGGLFATVTMSGAEGMMSYGVTRLLGGLVFSLGLVLVVVGGAQLFTGDALMVMAWASGRLTARQMLRVWTLVWIGNFAGAAGTAMLVFLSGQYTFGHGAVGATALYIATTKSGLPVAQAFPVQRAGLSGRVAGVGRPQRDRQDPRHHPAGQRLRRRRVRALRSEHVLHSARPAHPMILLANHLN
jgi:formate transporter